MACHLFGTKPLPEPMLTNCQLQSQEQTAVKFKSKYKVFIDENAFDNVCKITAILSRGDELTHWGLVTPYGIGDLGQHWFR